MSIAFLWVWEPFQLCSHCILCWIPRYSGNDPLWHSPCCYGSVDSDTLPSPNRTQHIFNEIALGGRSVVNLWSVVLNGSQLLRSPPANKEERFVWKSVQDAAESVCACPQERQITSEISLPSQLYLRANWADVFDREFQLYLKLCSSLPRC